MSILAGIFTRTKKRPIPTAARDSLRAAISRHLVDQATVFEDDRVCFMKVDLGAYGEPAMHTDPDGRLSWLAGEPILTFGAEDAGRGRAEDLARLHRAWSTGDWTALRSASGTFCAVYYDPKAERLCLIADKLGVRPLYYHLGQEFVVFATALRICEALPIVPKRMDLRAVTEMVSFGYPLGARTPFADVSMLRAAEVVQTDGEGTSRRQYWRWDDIAPSARPEAELVTETYRCFQRAVGRRLRDDSATTAFLSGGLDSRAIVTAIRERGVQVRTFNFARVGIQDQVFGAQFARAVGSVHEEAPKRGGDPRWSQMMATALAASPHRPPVSRPRDRLIWSGDGGSVGLGHVYMTEGVIALLGEGRTEEAVRQFLRERGIEVPTRILRAAVVPLLDGLPQCGMREELDDLSCAEPGRALYIFLMLNDQRRHLAQHFEDNDLHRLEFQLPFYDADFIASVVSVPVELCLKHRFYLKWLDRFPAVVKSVPWQAYPGHEPCPVPVPTLPAQWAVSEYRDERRLDYLRQAEVLLRAEDFPNPILKRGHLRLATMVHRAGMRDYAYLIKPAKIYHRYWSTCRGSMVMPTTGGAAAAASGTARS